MTYETVVQLSQTTTLIFFILLFLAVLVYAFWPSNKAKFERAAHVPLEQDPDYDQGRGPA
ncbi:MAG: cbb3-type cytochrome c oxidase subunit 3 [Hyphomicrobiaceae bacterium]